MSLLIMTVCVQRIIICSFLGIVNYVEFLTSIFLKYIAKKSKTYRKLTMPII